MLVFKSTFMHCILFDLLLPGDISVFVSSVDFFPLAHISENVRDAKLKAKIRKGANHHKTKSDRIAKITYVKN